MGTITVTETVWRGMEAWTLAADELELVITRIGAHIAAVRAPGDDLNPLWQPPWPAMRPGEGMSRADLYGDGVEVSLLSAIVGHNLCIDRFGPPRPGENRPVHGEAGVVEWSLEQADAETIRLTSRLPQASLAVARIFTIDGSTATVSTEVKPTDGAAHEIEWGEHVTLGDPFLDGARLAAEVDGAWIWGGEPRESWRFPEASAEGPVDAAAALAMPPADHATPVGDIVATRLTRGGFRAERPDLGRALTYEWNADEFPWLCLWTQHRSRAGKPWNGRTRARGMEFATKPFPEAEVPAERASEYQGRPTTCHVPAEGLRRSWTLRWERV